jgi:hypothetical protein
VFRLIRRSVSHPLLSIGSVLLWGLLEFAALQRSRRLDRRQGQLQEHPQGHPLAG